MVAPGSGREACLSCRGSLGEELVCETPRGFKLGESRCCWFQKAGVAALSRAADRRGSICGKSAKELFSSRRERLSYTTCTPWRETACQP